MIRLKFNFGPYEVIVEGQREHEVFHQASLWGEIALRCVGRENIILRHRTAQGYDFYEVEDASTGERLPMGQRKEDNGLYPKAWEPPYQAQESAPPERRLPAPPQQRPQQPRPQQAQRPTQVNTRPMPMPPQYQNAPQPQYRQQPPQPTRQYQQPPPERFEDLPPPPEEYYPDKPEQAPPPHDPNMPF